MNMQVNVEELRRQHRQAQERRARMSAAKQTPALASPPPPEITPAARHDWIIVATHEGSASVDTLKIITMRVCLYYHISRNDVISIRRAAHVVKGRHVAMYLAKEMTSRSLPSIGRFFGNRDHSTVLHAVRKISAQIQTDAVLAAEVEAIRRQIEGGDHAPSE